MRELYWVAQIMFLQPSDRADHGQNKSSECYISEISFAHVQAGRAELRHDECAVGHRYLFPRAPRKDQPLPEVSLTHPPVA